MSETGLIFSTYFLVGPYNYLPVHHHLKFQYIVIEMIAYI